MWWSSSVSRWRAWLLISLIFERVVDLDHLMRCILLLYSSIPSSSHSLSKLKCGSHSSTFALICSASMNKNRRNLTYAIYVHWLGTTIIIFLYSGKGCTFPLGCYMKQNTIERWRRSGQKLVFTHRLFLFDNYVIQHNMHPHSPLQTHIYKSYLYMSTTEGLSWQISKFTKAPQAPRCQQRCRIPLKA